MYKFFFIIVLLAIGSDKAEAQQDSNRIALHGKIVDSFANPIAFANILLTNNLDTTIVKTALSDSAGSFNIFNILPGQYKIKITHIDFISKSISFDFTNDQSQKAYN